MAGGQPERRQKGPSRMTITVGFLVFPGIQLLDLVSSYALPLGAAGLLG